MTIFDMQLVEEIWRKRKKDLSESIRGSVIDVPADTSSYCYNAGNHEMQPLAVVMPRDEQDVSVTLRFCLEHGIPCTPRGAGTSLNDCALGGGIILDMARHMNAIQHIDSADGTVAVQTGISIEALNRSLKAHGLYLPLFPVGGNKCTVGGCISLDTGGLLRSRYGTVRDMLVSVRGVDGNGNAFVLENRNATVTEGLPGLFSMEQLSSPFKDPRDLAGSEGSLAVLTQATLKAVPIPDARAYIIPFGSEEDAVKYGSDVNGAFACEFLDRTVTRAFCSMLGIGADYRCSLLIVTDREAGKDWVQLDLPFMDVLKKLTDALHLLQRQSARGRYVMGVEGAMLGRDSFLRAYEAVGEISRRYALNFLVFGDVREGIIHVRPFLDTRKEEGRIKHAQFLNEFCSRIAGHGGLPSVENGFGLQLKHLEGTYPHLMERVRELKNIHDPEGILLPSFLLEGESSSFLRGGTEAERRLVRASLNWNNAGLLNIYGLQANSYKDEMEACHGCGECRTLYTQARCPVFSATGSELTSPRGLNNLARRINTVGGIPSAQLYSESFKRAVFDFCIQCKLCTIECPTHVDTPKLIMEMRAEYIRRAGVSGVKRASSFFSDYELYTIVASSVARLANRLMKSGNFRAFLEHAMGVDRRLVLPEFDLHTFAEWYSRHEFNVGKEGRKGEVAYFADVYANYFNSTVGKALVLLLESFGYRVHFPKQRFTGLPLIYLGMKREARKYLLENVSYLYPYAVKNIPIVCTSPSAVMALRHEYLNVLDDDRSRTVSKDVMDAHEFLHPLMKQERLSEDRIAYFPCCHARALGSSSSAEAILRSAVSDFITVEAGCCGAGGSYTFAKETHSISLEIGKAVFSKIRELHSGGYTILTDGEECALHIGNATGVKIGLTLPYLAQKVLGQSF